MTAFARTLKRPPTCLPGLVAAAAVAGVVALMMMMPAPQALAASVAPAGSLPAANAAVGRDPDRDRSCDSCGIVQTIRRTDTTAGLAADEFTVRMRDGSTRDSSQAARGQWLEGDRVMASGDPGPRSFRGGSE